MMTSKMDMYSVLDDLKINDATSKTDDEFEHDNDEYNKIVDDLEIMENDLLTHYKDLDMETYLKLRQIDLLKKIVDKMDNLEMLYDVYKQLQVLNNK